MRGSIAIKLRVLGRFSATLGEDPATTIEISAKKGVALLAYLAVQPDCCASREELATLLWDDHIDSHARHSLRQCLLLLRKDLGAAAAQILSLDTRTVALNVRAVSIDAHEFAGLAESGKLDDLRRAAELYRGDFLAAFSLNSEMFDNWVNQERSRLAALAAGVLEALMRQLDDQGEGRLAIAAAERLTSIDPLREDWQRQGLRLRARYRGREAALGRASAVTALISSELGVEPESATKSLIADIRRGALSSGPPDVGPARSGRAAALGVPGEPVTDSPAVPSLDAKEQPASKSLALDGAKPPSAPPARSVVGSPEKSFPPRLLARTVVVAMTILCAIAALAPGFGTYRQFLARFGHTSAAPPPAAPSTNQSRQADAYPVPVVVTPFVMLGEAAHPLRWLADAMTDDLITKLARIPHLRVVSSQTAFSSRGTPEDSAAVGKRLGVRFSVEGSIRPLENTLRIHVALVDTASNLRVWTDFFEREGAQRHDVQGEITKRLARQLQIQVIYAASRGDSGENLHEIPIEALMAKASAAHWRRDSSKALAYFEEALRRRPDYVPAMTGVATQLVVGSSIYSAKPESNFDRAEQLLTRTLAVRPNSEIAHHWLGLIQRHRHDLAASLRSMARALEINPSNLSIEVDIGYTLAMMGRPKEGLGRIQRALKIYSLDSAPVRWLISAAEVEIELGEYRAALDLLQRGLQLRPNNVRIHGTFAAVYALLGERENAARHAAEVRRLLGATRFRELVGLFKQGGKSNQETQPRRHEGLALAFQGNL